MDFTKNTRYPKLKDSICFIAGDEHQFFDFIEKEENEEENQENQDNEDINNETKIFSQGPISTMNTFLYIFNKFKKGLYIKIKNNKIYTFLPFINQNYINEWHDRFNIFKTKENTYEFCEYARLYSQYWFLFSKNVLKQKTFESFLNDNNHNNKRKIEYKPKQEWHANNGIFRYDKSDFNNTKNNKLSILKMFETLCEKRKVPDVDFFVNARDNPILAKNKVEAYYHIFGKDYPLISHNYDKMCPILSMSKSEYYNDIMIPTFEDWNRIITSEYKQKIEWDENINYDYKFNYDWDTKIPKAVFRGSSTGYGYDEKTNPRIKLYEISSNNKNLMDVSITKWQVRPRIYNQEIKFIKPIIGESKKLSPQEQSNYKYIIHIEGHVAAYRLSLEMNMGSCILIVESDWKMWFSEKLKPFVHYIPIKKDLSDLVDKIKWCKINDDKCKKIAINAKKFYDKYLTENNILNYLQTLLYEISSTKKSQLYTGLKKLYNEDKKYIIKNLSLNYYKTLNYREKYFLRYLRINNTLIKYLVVKNINYDEKFYISEKTSKSIKTQYLTENVIKFNNKLWIETSIIPDDIKNILKYIKDEPCFDMKNINILLDDCKLNNFTRYGLNTLNALSVCLNNNENFINFFEYKKNINDNCKIYKIHNNLYIKEKSYKTEESFLNEAFISLNCLNKVLDYIPNFIFGFCAKNNMFYSEYVEGNTLQYCIKNNLLTEEDLTVIFYQVIFSIICAQTHCGFIHNDLTTYNIIIKPLNSNVDFNYFFKKKYTITSKFIAYIIDYDKSSVVAKNLNNISVHYGIINKNNKLKSADLFMFLLNLYKDIDNNRKYASFKNTIKNILKNNFIPNGKKLNMDDFDYSCFLLKKYTKNMSSYRFIDLNQDSYEIILKHFLNIKNYESNKIIKYSSDNKVLSEYILEYGNIKKSWNKMLEYYYTIELPSCDTYIFTLLKYFKILKSFDFKNHYKNVDVEIQEKLRLFFIDQYSHEIKKYDNIQDNYLNAVLIGENCNASNIEDIELLDLCNIKSIKPPYFFYYDYSVIGFLLRIILHSNIENVLFFDKTKLTEFLKKIIVLRFDEKNKVANHNCRIINKYFCIKNK